MARALRELRDIWADLTIEGLEAKDRRLSRSTISARERGEGLPSAKFLDAFVTACLRHRGWTPAAIIDELTHWTAVRNELDRHRRDQPVITTPSSSGWTQRGHRRRPHIRRRHSISHADKCGPACRNTRPAG
jgi:hypothetical protein